MNGFMSLACRISVKSREKKFILARVMRLFDGKWSSLLRAGLVPGEEEQIMMLIFFIATLLVCILIVFGVMISVTLHTHRVFKHRPRIWKRPAMRGAIFASPYLHDVLFAKNEKHHHFWSTEVEYDESYYL